jgi:hypothetical protein
VTLTSPPPEQASRQKEQGPNQREDRSYRDADQTQWQRQKPNNGKENQREERNGPAQHEQNAPPHKKNQSLHL